MKNVSKNILIPLDGSANSLHSLDYLDRLYGPRHNLTVDLYYVLPALPFVLTDDKRMRPKKEAFEKKSAEIARRILEEAKKIVTDKGFDEKKIDTIYHTQTKSTALDICTWANRKKVDAVLLTRRGRTQLDTILFGGVSTKLVNYCGDRPIWIAIPGPHAKKVLVCLDDSENAMRAVSHAAFMLSGTDCRITVFHAIKHLAGYIPLEALSESETVERLYQEKAGQQIAPCMEKARSIFMEAGLSEAQVDVKVIKGSTDVADDILKEAEGHYGTIVLGRHGQGVVKEFIFGSTTSKILYRSHHAATWIVQ